jgi:hypothetical protein
MRFQGRPPHIKKFTDNVKMAVEASHLRGNKVIFPKAESKGKEFQQVVHLSNRVRELLEEMAVRYTAIAPNTGRDAEAVFCIYKSDLGLRPIRHQNEDRVLAHILVCFLAYVLWKTPRQRYQRAGLGHEPRQVYEELGKIQLVDVVLPVRHGIRKI